MTKNRIAFNVTAHGLNEGRADYNKLRDTLQNKHILVEGEERKDGDKIMYVTGISGKKFKQIAESVDIYDIDDYMVTDDEELDDLETAFNNYDEFQDDDFDEIIECGDKDFVDECDEIDECDETDLDECFGKDCEDDKDCLFDESFGPDFDDDNILDNEDDYIETDFPEYEELDDVSDFDGFDDDELFYDEDEDIYESKKANTRRKLIAESIRRVNLKKRMKKRVARINESIRRSGRKSGKVLLAESIRRAKCKKALQEAIARKKGCCGTGVNKKSRLLPLSEALKASDEKMQKKLDQSVKSIGDIVRDVKGQTIGEHEAREAFKKLKAQQNTIKKIEDKDGKKFKVTDVTGVSSIIKKLIAADPEHAEEIKKWRDSLTESVVTALNNKQRTLHNNVKVNGKSIKNYTNKALFKLAKETKTLKESYVARLKVTETGTELSEKLKEAIAKKNQLMNILKEEMGYRIIVSKYARPLFEDEEKEEKNDELASSDISDDDLAKMFGAIDEPEDSEEKDADDSEEKDSEGSEDAEEETTEEVEISRVVIEMASKEDAEELMQYCVEAGIEEDAMEIIEGDEEAEEESEESDEEPAEGEETETEGEGDETANESMTYREIMRLFEDEETEEATEEPAEGEETETEGEGDEEATEEESEEGSVKFVLKDTDYIEELSTVLNDRYGITQEEFEEMIGGEIVNEESEDESDDDKSDEDTDEEKDEEKKDEVEDAPEEDEISASDIFGNM